MTEATITNPHPSDLLTSDEAAAWLRVKVRTLFDWRHRGTGPRYVRLGRCVRYELADLRAFVESCRVEAA